MPGFAYPDLLNLRQATRIAVATRVKNHQLSPAEAQLEVAKVDAQVAAAVESRENGLRMVNAQERAAAASQAAAEAAAAPSAPVTCMRTGTITTCN